MAFWVLSALLHAGVLGLLVVLYAKTPARARRAPAAARVEFVEPRHEPVTPEATPPSPVGGVHVEFDWVDAQPVVPAEAPPQEPPLADDPPAGPLRPPLPLLTEVPIEAARLRVKVKTPPPPPPVVPPAVAPPPRRQPGAPLRLVFRPDLRLYYPREMQLRGIEGSALVRIAVDPLGRVVDARIARSSGWPLLDRQALRVMFDHRYAPGDGGQAEVPVNFTLR